jgi:hypothetical protein
MSPAMIWTPPDVTVIFAPPHSNTIFPLLSVIEPPTLIPTDAADLMP